MKTASETANEMAMRRLLENEFKMRRARLWSIAHRITGTREDADEVLQETFVRAVVSPPPVLHESIFPWLIRVAMNLARDLLRKRKHADHARRVEGDELRVHQDERAELDLQGRYDVIEGAALAFELALDVLTPTAHAVFLLREVAGMSALEAAAALELSTANVRTTHHRARATLKAREVERKAATRRPRPSSVRLFVKVIDALRANDMRTTRALLCYRAPSRDAAPALGKAA